MNFFNQNIPNLWSSTTPKPRSRQYQPSSSQKNYYSHTPNPYQTPAAKTPIGGGHTHSTQTPYRTPSSSSAMKPPPSRSHSRLHPTTTPARTPGSTASRSSYETPYRTPSAKSSSSYSSHPSSSSSSKQPTSNSASVSTPSPTSAPFADNPEIKALTHRISLLNRKLESAYDVGNVEAAGSFAQNIAQLKKELRTRTKDLKEVAEKSDKERQASEAIIGKFNVIKTNMEERRLDIELTKKKILAFMQDKGMDASALESVQQMVKMNQVLLEKQCLNADSIDLTGGTISAETKANFKMMRKECIRRMQRMLQGLDKIESELKTFASFCAYLAAPTPATSPDAAAAKKENKNNINSNTHDNTSSGSSSSYSSHGNDSPTAYHTSYSAHKSTPSAVHNNTTASASDRSQTTTKPAKKRHLNTPHNSQYMQTPHNSHTHHTHGYNYRDRDASEPIVKNLQKNISDAHHRSMGDRDRHSRRSY